VTATAFRDRTQAGVELARHLAHLRGRPDLLVLALPRGGVPVAFEVARALQAPLDVFLVRKLGYPGHEEYAIGAIASGGVRVMNEGPGPALPPEEIDRIARREQAELERRERLYRQDRPVQALEGRTVIVVDDGLATGATMRAATEAIRLQRPSHLCVAVPVGAPESCDALEQIADEVVCPVRPQPFRAVGLWYSDFPQCTDDEVRDLLRRARQPVTS
jgi:putative phosphoribosyl transferase